jgi:hypothetical protein
MAVIESLGLTLLRTAVSKALNLTLATRWCQQGFGPHVYWMCGCQRVSGPYMYLLETVVSEALDFMLPGHGCQYVSVSHACSTRLSASL